MRILLSAALAITLVAGAAEARKTYSGQEAAALRCAAILSLVPSAMARAGMIPQSEVRMFHTASSLILARYVTGTQDQKLKALRAVMGRKDAEANIRDFQTKAKTCLRQFPLS